MNADPALRPAAATPVRKDAGKDEGSSYIPDDQFMAIFDTSDREKLVKS